LASLLTTSAVEAQRRPAMDPVNPTCPASPNWSTNRQMTFRVLERPGQRPVLLAEGVVDADLVQRLRTALETFQGDEIWLRSPGGDARIGNQAGRIIREQNLQTRIPEGWACFSACNVLFMGGTARYVDPGGLFIVHMFTFTNNRQAIRQATNSGEQGTVGLIGDIEQQSAQLASEDNDFLIRMGLYRTLLTEVMYSQRAVPDGQNQSTMRCLTQEEVRRYNVVNTGGRPAH
jgi:hypothetical protein